MSSSPHKSKAPREISEETWWSKRLFHVEDTKETPVQAIELAEIECSKAEAEEGGEEAEEVAVGIMDVEMALTLMASAPAKDNIDVYLRDDVDEEKGAVEVVDVELNRSLVSEATKSDPSNKFFAFKY